VRDGAYQISYAGAVVRSGSMLSAVMIVLWQASPDLSGFAMVPVEAEDVGVTRCCANEAKRSAAPERVLWFVYPGFCQRYSPCTVLHKELFHLRKDVPKSPNRLTIRDKRVLNCDDESEGDSWLSWFMVLWFLSS
jgi:hypothetical protein